MIGRFPGFQKRRPGNLPLNLAMCGASERHGRIENPSPFEGVFRDLYRKAAELVAGLTYYRRVAEIVRNVM